MQPSRAMRLASSSRLLPVMGLLLWTTSLSLPCAAQGSSDELPTIKVDVQLVSLTATVEDRSGRPITNLRKEDFVVYEDGTPQQLSVFHDDERVPVSVGILFDTSGSMVDKIDDVQDAVGHFVRTTNPEDDIFLIEFNKHTRLVEDFTGDRERLRRAIGRLRPGGATALYDAVAEGLQHLQAGRHKKKALLLITDGNDNSSDASLREVVATAQQSEALVYAMGIGHGERGSFGHLAGIFKDEVDIDVLRQLAEITGGRAVLVEGEHHRGGVDVIDQAAQDVGAELRGQYTLGYYPTNRVKDGSYRRIRIEVRNPQYVVRTRQGYFSPTS